MDISHEDWIFEFSYRHWVLAGDLEPAIHIARAESLYETAKHLHPELAASLDIQGQDVPIVDFDR